MILYRTRLQRGFTLLEMILAIAIFASISLGTWQMFQSIISAREIVVFKNNQLIKLEQALLTIDQDLKQIIDRGTRGENGITAQSIFSSVDMLESEDEGLAIVRAGWHNPKHYLPRSTLQRVFYRLKEKKLERQYNYMLDPDMKDSEPPTQVLLENVNSLKFRFYENGAWQEEMANEAFPQGIEIEFDLEGVGKIQRRYMITAPWNSDL